MTSYASSIKQLANSGFKKETKYDMEKGPGDVGTMQRLITGKTREIKLGARELVEPQS